MREMHEELHIEMSIDPANPPVFLGGYQLSRARDSLVNDHFSTFAVHLHSAEFQPDQVELEVAHFFNMRAIVDAFVAAGRPQEKKTFPLPSELIESPERVEVSVTSIYAMETYLNDGGLKCKYKATPANPPPGPTSKVYIGV